ncbi:hypothetical protein ACQPXS_02545 [Streptomyces sp. CA-142005]|uniref:hypothetical protein n=1 Tax=Streptomyces sp. CA-142005 TaxID=3240052 RepID=UPI003D8ADE08
MGEPDDTQPFLAAAARRVIRVVRPTLVEVTELHAALRLAATVLEETADRI